MTALPIAFRSNVGKYNFLGTTTLLNCYAEKRGDDAKGPLSVIPCDGTLTFSAATDTPCRGMLLMRDLDLIYAVFSSYVWKINSAGTATLVGVVPGTDRVQMTRNQKATAQIVIRCDAGVFIVESDVVSLFTLPGAETVISVDTIAGYTVYGIATGVFFISSINEAKTVAALDFATAEQRPDRLVRVFVLGGELLMMKQTNIEPWINTGNATFPFELRGTSSVVRKGLLAEDSVAEFDNTIAFVGNDGFVYRYAATPTRISNEEVERAIRDDASQSTISAFSWSRGGHQFYTLTGSTWTYSYDAVTQVWHKRETYNSNRWRHDFAVETWGEVIVGDRNTGNLYSLDSSTYTEAGSTMIFGVDSPPMHVFPKGGIVDSINIDFATGGGVVSSTATGYDPALMLSWSDDGGNTYKAPRQIKTGKRGVYKTRVRTMRCGRFGTLGRTWRIRISDPVPRALVNVDAAVRPLVH